MVAVSDTRWVAWDTGPVPAIFGYRLVPFLAQLGDLAGSALKRAAGVKDSGWIFPGMAACSIELVREVFAVVFAYYWSR